MMFKKGSFEIGATVYPVAIKVRVILLLLPVTCYLTFYQQLVWNNAGLTVNCGVLDPHSMIPALEMPSGIAVNLEWSTTCCEWWAVGLSSAACGTFPPCLERWESMVFCDEWYNQHIIRTTNCAAITIWLICSAELIVHNIQCDMHCVPYLNKDVIVDNSYI